VEHNAAEPRIDGAEGGGEDADDACNCRYECYCGDPLGGLEYIGDEWDEDNY
jgi:hypothetical protein